MKYLFCKNLKVKNFTNACIPVFVLNWLAILHSSWAFRFWLQLYRIIILSIIVWHRASLCVAQIHLRGRGNGELYIEHYSTMCSIVCTCLHSHNFQCCLFAFMRITHSNLLLWLCLFFLEKCKGSPQAI